MSKKIAVAYFAKKIKVGTSLLHIRAMGFVVKPLYLARMTFSKIRKMKSCFTFLLLLATAAAQAQLDIYPALPDTLFQSRHYQIKLKQTGSFRPSYVLGEAKYITNIKNEAARAAMSDFNHWTTFSFGGVPVTVEVASLKEAIKTCEIFPKKEKINASIRDGKASFTLKNPGTKLYFLINGDEENPLFIFADSLEKDTPKPKAKGVLYFAPGQHDVGVKYRIPDDVHTVYLAGGSYVRGSFYAENRSNLTIRGRGIISGDGLEFAANNGVNDTQDNIAKSAICLNGPGQNLRIEGVTIMRPLKFSVVMRGSGTVSNVKCFGWNYTVDGVVTGDHSTVENSFFKVNDDVVKIYADNMTVRNLVIYHQTNGAIFQLGWSGQRARNCLVENIDIVKDETVQDNDVKGNHAIVNWRKSNGTTSENLVFQNITADRGYCRLVGINLSEESDGSLKNVRLKNISLAQQTYPNYARTKTGAIELTLENVRVAGRCVEANDFLREGKVLTKTNCR